MTCQISHWKAVIGLDSIFYNFANIFGIDTFPYFIDSRIQSFPCRFNKDMVVVGIYLNGVSRISDITVNMYAYVDLY